MFLDLLSNCWLVHNWSGTFSSLNLYSGWLKLLRDPRNRKLCDESLRAPRTSLVLCRSSIENVISKECWRRIPVNETMDSILMHLMKAINEPPRLTTYTNTSQYFSCLFPRMPDLLVLIFISFYSENFKLASWRFHVVPIYCFKTVAKYKLNI